MIMRRVRASSCCVVIWYRFYYHILQWYFTATVVKKYHTIVPVKWVANPQNMHDIAKQYKT